MREYLEIGCSPNAEICVQVGESNYVSAMEKELMLYKKQLLSRWPEADLRIKWFSHDFGSYGEIVVYYPEDAITEADEEEQNQAFEIESNCPDHWGYWDSNQWIVLSKEACQKHFKGVNK